MKRSGPIRRTCALKRSPFRRKPAPPNRAGSDPAHLAWVRRQPCAVCGTTRNVEAHHPRLGNGMSRKAPDREAFPLCFLHHQLEFHQHRGFFAGWTKEQRRVWQREMSVRYAPKGAP